MKDNEGNNILQLFVKYMYKIFKIDHEEGKRIAKEQKHLEKWEKNRKIFDE